MNTSQNINPQKSATVTGLFDFQESTHMEENQVKSFCQIVFVFSQSFLRVPKKTGFSSEILRNQERFERKQTTLAVLTSKNVCQVSKVN